jgi:hypothetical protein
MFTRILDRLPKPYAHSIGMHVGILLRSGAACNPPIIYPAKADKENLEAVFPN